MPIVAVAGGTGDLGRSIVDALQAEGGHEIVVLTRRKAEDETLGGARTVVTDYHDADRLADLLDSLGVHTVISTLNTLQSADAELALVKAADQASSVRRYIPSIWGVKVTPE